MLKYFLPWLLAAAIFYYLFTRYPVSHLLEALSYVNLPFFIAYSLFYFIFMWIADCWGLAKLFARLGFPTKTRELLTLRLASYPIMIFNYGAAQGAMAYFFKREKNVPFLKSTSLISFIIMIDLYWAVTLAFVGSFFSGFVIGDLNLKKVLWTLWLLATAGLLLLLLVARLPSLGRVFNWLRDHHLFAAYRSATLLDYFYALFLRFPMHLAINSTFYFLAIAFGVHIPFLAVLTYLPLTILIGSLPITPGALGVTQIVAVELFQDKISGPLLTAGTISAAELIVMMTLSFQLVNYLLKGISGSFFIKKALLNTQ